MDGQPPMNSATSTPPSAASRTVAAAKQAARKSGSRPAPLAEARPRMAGSAADISAVDMAYRVAGKWPVGRAPTGLGGLLIDRLAVRPGDLQPGLADQALHVVRQRHVVERLRGRVAVLVGPVEEGKHVVTGIRVGLLGMHEDEGRTADRPGAGARLVEEEHIVARRRRPFGAGSGRREGVR